MVRLLVAVLRPEAPTTPAAAGLGRRLFVVLVCLPLIGRAQTYPTPRVTFPFDASREGSVVDKSIRILDNRVYHFDLLFEFGDQADKERVFKLVGDGSRYPDGRWGKPGVAIPIHLTISSIGGDAAGVTVVDKTFHTESKYATGAREFVRTVANLRLAPGLYRVQVRTTQETPDFKGTRTSFEVGFDPKAAPIR